MFSPNKAIVAAETKFIEVKEIVGSVKTTSKDRIDKVFLDKYLLTKLLGRNVPVVAVFLHDVQRARRGKSIFGINSTFKSSHSQCKLPEAYAMVRYVFGDWAGPEDALDLSDQYFIALEGFLQAGLLA